jgi:GNAT superfamily N-acetyltransferase
MTIRRAIVADANRVVELLKASHIAAGFDRADGPTGFSVPFEPSYAMRLFLAHVTMPRMLALTLDVDGEPQGILMAVAYEHKFGPVWMAGETVWWIDPGHRGISASRMLDDYERWARDVRCAFAGMAGMGEDPDVAKLYRRRGYRVAETHFLKVL